MARARSDSQSKSLEKAQGSAENAEDRKMLAAGDRRAKRRECATIVHHLKLMQVEFKEN